MIFGADLLGEDFKQELSRVFNVSEIKNVDSYKLYQTCAVNAAKTVVLLHDMFSVGSDLKHPKDALVIVYTNKDLTREEIV